MSVIFALCQVCISSSFEQLADERDFALNSGLLVADVAVFDGSDCFNTAEGRLGRSQ